jgi:solute carrier family 25 citrate transporter 1
LQNGVALQKIQMQLSSQASTAASTQPKFTGAWDVIRSTFRDNGWRGFYKGASTFFVFALPRSAVRFSVFQAVGEGLIGSRAPSPSIGGKGGSLTAMERAMAGMLTGVVEAVTMVTPMTTIQTKLVQAQAAGDSRYSGVIGGVRTMVKEEGWRGVYRGVVPTVIKVAINQCVRFLCYAEFRQQLQAVVQRSRGRPAGEAMEPGAMAVVLSLVSGAAAGVVSVLVNQPVDVVKSNMQGLHASRYRGAVHCAIVTVREDGLRGLYKGLLPRVARVAVEVSLTFALFEVMSAGVDTALHGVPFKPRPSGV